MAKTGATDKILKTCATGTILDAMQVQRTENGTMEQSGLEGRFLIAMPGIGDERFHRSVILVCAHSDQGAMGLVINQKAESINFDELLEQLEIEPNEKTAGTPIRIGGPVESGRGFVLHSSDYDGDNALDIAGKFMLTGTVDILRDIVGGNGPRKRIIALGYTGWAPGQLEQEIQQNGWLSCDADPEIVFAEGDDDKWVAALDTLGVAPELLSAQGGTA
jgi:putative transcriptional regulator